MSFNSSRVVYAYADQFLDGRPRRGGVELPCRDVRVKKRALAEAAMVAAFVGLTEAKQIQLSVGKRRVLLGLRKRPAVFVEPLTATELTNGLEQSMLEALRSRQGASPVLQIIERMLPLSEDPWGDVIGRIEEGMLEQGFFVEGERGRAAKFFLGRRLEPDCQRIAALQDQVTLTSQMLSAFRHANPATYEQLVKDVHQGIRARLEVDVDVDFD